MQDLLTHEAIWRAVDRLAAHAGRTPSGLARHAGLDPTTFSRSKRISPTGKPRWPSTESLAKALQAAGMGLTDFLLLVRDTAGQDGPHPPSRNDRPAPAPMRLRTIPAGGPRPAVDFDAGGCPRGTRWYETQAPDIADPDAFCLEILDDSFQPVYRRGDRILASPRAPIRAGDRLLLQLHDGPMLARLLDWRSERRISLQPLSRAGQAEEWPLDAVSWHARIVQAWH